MSRILILIIHIVKRMICNDIHFTYFMNFKGFIHSAVSFSHNSVADIIFQIYFMAGIDGVSYKGDVFLIKIIQPGISHLSSNPGNFGCQAVSSVLVSFFYPGAVLLAVVYAIYNRRFYKHCNRIYNIRFLPFYTINYGSSFGFCGVFYYLILCFGIKPSHTFVIFFNSFSSFFGTVFSDNYGSFAIIAYPVVKTYSVINYFIYLLLRINGSQPIFSSGLSIHFFVIYRVGFGACQIIKMQSKRRAHQLAVRFLEDLTF